MIRFTAQDGAITFAVRAQPRATKSAIAGEVEGSLKIRLAAPPVDGAANEELMQFLARLFDVSRRNITLLSGATAKTKILQINGLASKQFESILAAHLTPNT